MDKQFVSYLISILLENKEIPKYQFERRIDIFLQVFLPILLKVDIVIPDFPIKKEGNKFLSTNIDFFAYSKTKHKGYFIELKTDNLSIKKGQIESYLKAIDKGWTKLIYDIKNLKDKSKRKEKYTYLFNKLKDIDLGTIDLIFIAPLKSKEKLNPYCDKKRMCFWALEDLKDMTVEKYKHEWKLITNALSNISYR